MSVWTGFRVFEFIMCMERSQRLNSIVSWERVFYSLLNFWVSLDRELKCHFMDKSGKGLESLNILT